MPKQFQQKFELSNGTKGVIIMIGWPADAKNIEKLTDKVISEANHALTLFDANNPSSDIYKLNSSAGISPVKVSWQVLNTIKTAIKVSNWTKGAFDIVTSNGDYRNISIDENSQTVDLKNHGMQLNLEQILDGFLADYMLDLIYTAKMANAMVKVGNVFRGIGQSLFGPWKIQVQEDSEAYARHALNLTVSNTGIATISATQFKNTPLIDFRSKKQIKPKIKGATVVMPTASEAQGLAYAVFVLGPDEGINFLNKLGNARGLIVDSEGKFLKTAGM